MRWPWQKTAIDALAWRLQEGLRAHAELAEAQEYASGRAVTVDHDAAGDGIALFSAAHPTLPWYKLPLTWAAALSFNARCATADALVWLAEKIGPFQYYGRDK